MKAETDVDLAIIDALDNEAKPTDGRLYIRWTPRTVAVLSPWATNWNCLRKSMSV